jgi:hypothetical protein
VKINGGGEGI